MTRPDTAGRPRRGPASRSLTILALALALAGAPGDGLARAQDLVIGVAAPMTGNLARVGQQFAEGARLAADLWNARGGIEGRKVALRLEDDGGDPKEATAVARKLAADDRVLAVLGHYSSAACLAAIPIYAKARLAVITPSASQADLTARGGPYLFRMWSPVSVSMAGLARYAVKTLGKRRLAVIHGEGDPGRRARDAFRKALDRLGAKAVATEAVHDGDTDFTAPLTKVKAAGPDGLVILTQYTTGALVVREARTLGIAAALVGADTLHEDGFIELAGAGPAEGLVVNTDFSADDPAAVVARFVLAYQQLHPGERPGPYHATTYDAARVLLSAIEKVGTDRDAIREAIAATRAFPGVTGTFAFDGQREREPEDQAYLAVKDGKWVYLGRTPR